MALGIRRSPQNLAPSCKGTSAVHIDRNEQTDPKTPHPRERENMELRMDRIPAYRADSRTAKSPQTLGIKRRSVAPANSRSSGFFRAAAFQPEKKTTTPDKASDENIEMASSSFLYGLESILGF